LKVKISDMMDSVECAPVKIQERDIVSAERIKEAAMKKIQNGSSRARYVRCAGRISRTAVIAAVLVLCFSTAAAAAAVVKWGGFAYTDGMSDREKRVMLENVSRAFGGRMVDERNGDVHYLDENGAEVMVLSAQEAAEYEAARREAASQAVLESTALVDLSTLPLLPGALVEVATGDRGEFKDFMMGNGIMILLHPDGGDGYLLRQGDTVTIAMDSNDECRLAFGVFRDGVFVGEEISLAQKHCHTITIEEDGRYDFTAMYYSAGTSSFTNCRVEVVTTP